jgi:hypothetical protein
MSIFLGQTAVYIFFREPCGEFYQHFVGRFTLNFLDIFLATHIEFSLYFDGRVAVNIFYIFSVVFNKGGKNAYLVIGGDILA